MRVKINDTWFEVGGSTFGGDTTDGGDKIVAIMIELSPANKTHIQNMLPEATKYAVFDIDAFDGDKDEKLKWMDE